MIKKANIIFTNYCNFNCSFCGYRKSHARNARSIDFVAVKKFLRKAKKEGYWQLRITGGGEPTLALDKLLKTVRFAKKIGFRNIEIVTNGSYILYSNPEKIIKKLRKADLKGIFLSVDSDHLRFTSYSKIISAIRLALDNGIRVQIRCVNRRVTYRRNLSLLEQISKDLNGKLIKIPGLIGNKINFLMVFPYRPTVLNYISGLYFSFCKVPFRKLKNENSSRRIEKIICEYCGIPDYLVIDPDLNIFPCIFFYPINNPKLYSMGKLTDIKTSFEKALDSFMKKIIHDKFFFIRMYLKVKNNEKLKKILMKESFFQNCDFCLWLQKHRKEIEKIPDVSNFHLIFFILLHFHFLLKNYIADLIDTSWRESPLLRRYDFPKLFLSLLRFLKDF